MPDIQAAAAGRKPSLWFVVPVHNRLQLAAICLRQLRRTCDALQDEGIDATAVVIGDARNLRHLQQLDALHGFGTVERDNQFVSRRFNDGIQLACDPKVNPRPADYVVPCGSDDWVDHRIFLNLPPANTVVGFPQMAFVREDGGEIVARNVNCTGGPGIRIYPRQALEPLGYRPADEDRRRGCDTSIITNLQREYGPNLGIRLDHHHPFQIIDWKSHGQQLNTFGEVGRWRVVATGEPFEMLRGVYPDEALEEMRAHYKHANRRALVAA